MGDLLRCNRLSPGFRNEPGILAVRAGIIFGAMKNYANELDAPDARHLAVLNLVLAAATRTAAAATPSVASSFIVTAGDTVNGFLSLAATKNWKPDVLTGQIEGQFCLQVEQAAKNGQVLGRATALNVRNPADKALADAYAGFF